MKTYRSQVYRITRSQIDKHEYRYELPVDYHYMKERFDLTDDHIFPLSVGYQFQIPAGIIGDASNVQLLTFEENSKKGQTLVNTVKNLFDRFLDHSKLILHIDGKISDARIESIKFIENYSLVVGLPVIPEVMSDLVYVPIIPKYKTYSMSGCPMSAGFQNKRIFESYVSRKTSCILAPLTKKTDYLIVGELYNTSPSNLKTAEKYNIEIITYKEFVKKFIT